MKLRLLEIGLFAGASIGLSYYVGGIGLSVVFLSAFFLWAVFSAYDFFPTYSRYLASLVISTFIPVLTVVVVVPQLARNSWLRSIIFTPPSFTPTDYMPIDSNILGTTNQWVLFTVFGFFLVAILTSLALRNHYWKFSENHKSTTLFNKTITNKLLRDSHPAISRYVVLAPLIALSYLQNSGHTKSLAFMMSGDSRNIFRFVMRIRVTSSYPTVTRLFQNGGYGETLTSAISAMNGTTGFPRVADLTAMRSMYVIVFSLIVASVSVLFTAKSEKWNPIVTLFRDLVIVGISILVLLSPYPFAEILRSGFFSFFVGLGFLTAAVALLFPAKIQGAEGVLAGSLATLATFLSYQPAVFLVLPLLFVLWAQFLWQRFQSRIAHNLILSSFLATGFIAYVTYQPVYERLVLRVGISGEIWPTNENFTWYVFVTAAVLTLVSRGDFRRTLLSVTSIGASAVLGLRLIVLAKGQDPDVYYLMKLMYATNFVSGILCIAIVSAIFNESAIWSRFQSARSPVMNASLVMRFVAILGLVGGLFFSISNHTQASSPVSLIRKGWDTPSTLVAQKTFELWVGSTPYIFAGYFTAENDRIANFWSPYFWEGSRWEWTYGGYSVSTEGLCSIIDINKVTVYTRTSSLKKNLDDVCANVSLRTKVRSSDDNMFVFTE